MQDDVNPQILLIFLEDTLSLDSVYLMFFRVGDDETLFDSKNYMNLSPWKEEEYLCTCEFKSLTDILPNVDCSANKVKTCKQSQYTPTHFPCAVASGRYARDVHFDDASDTHASIETSLHYDNEHHHSRIYPMVCIHRRISLARTSLKPW